MTKSEIDLLTWLGREEFSQYGECFGAPLDGLLAKGLVQLSPRDEDQESFIAKGVSKMYCAVSLTDAGRAFLKAGKP